MQRLGGRAPSTPRSLFGQFFHGPVHADAPHFVDIADIGVERAVFHIGAEAPD